MPDSIVCPFAPLEIVLVLVLLPFEFLRALSLPKRLGSIFAVGSIADFVQQAYCGVKEPNEPD